MESELELARAFAAAHPTEVAQLLEGLETRDIASFLSALPGESAAEVVEVMESYSAVRCLESVEAGQGGQIVEQLPLERGVVLLRRMEDESRKAILEGLPEEQKGILEVLLRYPEGTAGALMNPRLFTLPPDIDVEEALRRVRTHSRDAMYYLYVVDRNQQLAGVVNIRELMQAGPQERIDAVMHREVVRIGGNTPLPAVLAHPGWLEYHVLPVVDENGLFIGALRHKNLRRLISQSGDPHPEEGVRSTGEALGELFQIGLAGLARGATGRTSRGTDE